MVRRRAGSLASDTGDPLWPARGMEVMVVQRVRARVRDLLELLGDEGGATAIEYGLMLMLIAMVVFVAVQFLGQSTSNAYNSVSFSP
jgi:pilus assembly protein Flp/PilA